MRSQDLYKCDLSDERRAAIRANLACEVVIIADDGSYHVTTYGALEAMIVRLFIENGSTSLYVDGNCIAMNYGRARGYEPTARAAYANRMKARGYEPIHISALSGLTLTELKQFNRYRHKRSA